MRLALLTGALSVAFVVGVLGSLVAWVVGALTGADGIWTWVAPLVAILALAFGVATYLAERVAHRRTLSRMRATGEPWAFRED